jgi:hypothetical protein
MAPLASLGRALRRVLRRVLGAEDLGLRLANLRFG